MTQPRAWLGSRALAFEGAPWSGATLGTVGAFPNPAPSPFFPAPSYQRPRQPVPMLGEIVAEPALHAGGTLVGCVQLDVGGGDADDLVVGDVQVDLAADAAVG